MDGTPKKFAVPTTGLGLEYGPTAVFHHIPGGRLWLPSSALSTKNGHWHAPLGHGLVCLGRAPSGVIAGDGTPLIVTSAKIVIGQCDLLVACALCKSLLPLRLVGLRHLKEAGEVRNQPRCGTCRTAPYQK